MSIEPSEKHWANALEEFESAERRAGVWAKAFAESRGDENAAKAMYLQQRAAQLAKNESDKASDAVARMAAPKSDSTETLRKLISAFGAGYQLTTADIEFLAGASETDSSIVTLQDRYRGQTLLHWCALLGARAAAIKLIKNGANAAAVNGDAKRPHELTDDFDLHRLLLRAATKAESGAIASTEIDEPDLQVASQPAVAVNSRNLPSGIDDCFAILSGAGYKILEGGYTGPWTLREPAGAKIRLENFEQLLQYANERRFVKPLKPAGDWLAGHSSSPTSTQVDPPNSSTVATMQKGEPAIKSRWNWIWPSIVGVAIAKLFGVAGGLIAIGSYYFLKPKIGHLVALLISAIVGTAAAIAFGIMIRGSISP